mgnify:CR=1 FL=1
MNLSLSSEILQDDEGRDKISSALVDDFDTNWSTTDTRAMEWEARKVVI